MIGFLIFISISLFALGLALLYLLKVQSEKFGILKGKNYYSDTDKNPGEVLYSKTLPLAGKPDYITKEDGFFIPVEYKTSKTSDSAHKNHIMQLFAYCYLVEELYNQKPPYGYLKYPNKEFKILYTADSRESVKSLVNEILEKKQFGDEMQCVHPEHKG
jgi:CRISPR-associated exonuclease Cas4